LTTKEKGKCIGEKEGTAQKYIVYQPLHVTTLLGLISISNNSCYQVSSSFQ